MVFFAVFFISFLNSNGLFSASLYAEDKSVEHQSRETVCIRAGSAKRKSVLYSEPVSDLRKAMASCGEIKHTIFESRDIVKITCSWVIQRGFSDLISPLRSSLHLYLDQMFPSCFARSKPSYCKYVLFIFIVLKWSYKSFRYLLKLWRDSPIHNDCCIDPSLLNCMCHRRFLKCSISVKLFALAISKTSLAIIQRVSLQNF